MSQTDLAHAHDSAHVAAGMASGDFARWSPVAVVEKYDDDQARWVARKSGMLSPIGSDFEALNVRPYETVERAGNLLTTAGLTRLTSLLTGAGGTAVTATTARLGVGNSATAAAVGQTDLQASAGSGNRQFKVMDATYPQTAAGVLTVRSSFATGEGNFAWAEWGIDIGTATVTDGTTVNAALLNRAVQSLGTKVSGVWVLTATITIS